MSDEKKVSGRYRELPHEEPPRALDDAILAASRRAVDSRPAPLVVPSGRRRWYFPVAAAAIIVLAVVVTVHVEREQPGEEIVSAVEPQKEVIADQAKREPARRAEPRPFAVEPPPPEAEQQARRKEKAVIAPSAPPPAAQPESREAAKAPVPTEAPPSAPPQRSIGSAQDSAGVDRRDKLGALAKRADEAKKQGVRAAREEEGIPGSAGPLPALAQATPEQRLQGIADLRRQGRHEDADKALAEFRRAYPQYRISEEMRAKVERK
jgi:hypothetical protein